MYSLTLHIGLSFLIIAFWYTLNTIMMNIDLLAYFMDKNVYIILWGIFKFGDRVLGFNQTTFIVQ